MKLNFVWSLERTKQLHDTCHNWIFALVIQQNLAQKNLVIRSYENYSAAKKKKFL
jgi:hypothetical protein